MLLRELANSGTRLPEIGCGTGKYSGGVEPLRAAIECGAGLIDTAEAYGTEEIVGRAIKGQRDRVFLASKVLPRNFKQRDLIAAAERSLRRLGTDHIDLYQLHWPNLTIPIEEPMRGMEKLVDAGTGLGNIRVVDPERFLRRVAEASAKSEAQVALNWCISRENVIAIPKASTVAHVMENVGASGWKLQPELARLLEDRIRYRRRGALQINARRAVRWGMQMIGHWE